MDDTARPSAPVASPRRSLYVETSIVSYLAAQPASDVVVRARQLLTHRWWAERRGDFALVIAQPVLTEAAAGDRDAAGRRMRLLHGLPALVVTTDARELAESIQEAARLPRRASVDALHVALAAVHGVEFILTWNMRHIANAARRSSIEAACRLGGYAPPSIATPDALLEG